MGDQVSQWQQLTEEIIGDVVWQIANHLEPVSATLPETRSTTCVLQLVSS